MALNNVIRRIIDQGPRYQPVGSSDSHGVARLSTPRPRPGRPDAKPSLERVTVAPTPPRGPSGASDRLDGQQVLALRLAKLGLPERPQYRTGLVARILGVSRETVRQYTLLWEPEEIPLRNPIGLFSYTLKRHRRVPHEALVRWIDQNSTYHRQIL